MANVVADKVEGLIGINHDGCVIRDARFKNEKTNNTDNNPTTKISGPRHDMNECLCSFTEVSNIETLFVSTGNSIEKLDSSCNEHNTPNNNDQKTAVRLG